MIRRILLATDGSETAKRAASLAADVAACSHAEVTVLSVVEPAPYTDLGPTYVDYIDDLERVAREIADEQTEELRREGLAAETEVEVSPSIVESIVETAEKTRADLIVMGTHGRSGLRRAILGSVADGVVRSGRTPVLLAKAEP